MKKTLIPLLLSLALASHAAAQTDRDPAQCAALWYGMTDAAADYPGTFGTMPDTHALAAQFAALAGPDAADRIAAQRADFRLIAKAKVLGRDRISSDLFDRIAESCDALLASLPPSATAKP
ncbi:hypothetical protein DL237_08220 [Pseudooceanicola sediminis]|uniref:Signal recognition particle n=1 Tax=Pseudooceanicola sediminis TaxID=2211117 RepID=A0A399J1I9_9RHOB|nr:hypothetical protein [Pseudooceanicola sediminis]KAA2316224.1 hypothetical protein E0K93_05075 [Puniceibacterium sp. HSS470]RII39134.1 hypothetical protein DL237_08220 [Pseudooceanicola sediminis]|tara:strand:- start:36090 stop:36452 length:363 start_codon:yes stop_codon:yes gene_type:complete